MYPNHLDNAFNLKCREQAVKRAVDRLRNVAFNTIVVHGLSGLVIGSIVAHALQKGLSVIRKTGEKTHSINKIETTEDKLGKYVILDDLIDSGKTLAHIYKTITKFDKDAECVGVYLHHNTYHKPDFDGYVQYRKVYGHLKSLSS
jgi:adenine/guanine phosphoribosyltransferase-like PRPP-binding protein